MYTDTMDLNAHTLTSAKISEHKTVWNNNNRWIALAVDIMLTTRAIFIVILCAWSIIWSGSISLIALPFAPRTPVWEEEWKLTPE